MKTSEELSAIKAEVEAMKSKLAELSEEEVKTVTGGIGLPIVSGDARCPNDGTPLEYTGIYSGRQSDVFKCPRCCQHYEHIFYMDQWIYFNNF